MESYYGFQWQIVEKMIEVTGIPLVGGWMKIDETASRWRVKQHTKREGRKSETERKKVRSQERWN